MFQIQKKLSPLSISQLQMAARLIEGGQEISIVPELSEAELYNLIVDYVRSEKLKNMEDEGMSQLLFFFDFLDGLSQVPGEDPRPTNTDEAVNLQQAEPSARDDTHILSTDQDGDAGTQSPPRDIHTDLSATISRTGISSKDQDACTLVMRGALPMPATAKPASGAAPKLSTNINNQVIRVTDVASLLPRREFKLHGGQICDAGCDMSFNCLCKQIDEGLQEGFSESEVIRSVLKITKPGTFKEMLVNKDDLTVDGLKKFLRSHIRDKNATELFQELTSARQNDKESPQQFLYRIMGLKQRLLFESQQPGVGFSYNKELIQGTFLHTLYQGLNEKNSHVRHDLKAFLSDLKVSDDLLLEQITKSTAEEEGRVKRLGALSKHRPVANIVHIAQHSQNELDAQAKVDVELQANRDAIKELTAQVSSLTKHLAQMSSSTETAKLRDCNMPTNLLQQQFETRGKCSDCVRRNNMNCAHCFVCGQAGHRAIGCLQRKLSGNGKRSLEKGSQRP